MPGSKVQALRVEGFQKPQEAENCATEVWNAFYKHILGTQDYLEFRLKEFKAIRAKELKEFIRLKGAQVDILSRIR